LRVFIYNSFPVTNPGQTQTGAQTGSSRHERIGSTPDAIADLKAGKFIILVDDANRENEGDLVFPAENITPEIINFYETHVRGWICVATAPSVLDRLELPLMVDRNTERHGTAFTVTVDAARGTTTGISAADQARTVRVLANPVSNPDDLLRPGHVRPVRARVGGVLERAGHTEAVVDLMRISGFQPVGTMCEIKNPDGSMARLPELIDFAEAHDIRIYTIEDLIAYRLLSERLLTRVVETDIDLKWGRFRAIGYESIVRDEEHLALVYGDPGKLSSSGAPVLVRVHPAHVLCDLFGLHKNAEGDRIEAAMRKIVENGSGVFVYLRSRLRGRRMLTQLRGLKNGEIQPEEGMECEIPPEHAKRDYGLGAQIILDLGLKRISVLTDHPTELVGMAGYGIEIVGHEPLT
jgi:3,4-dihydroxy 2-butanone 4-phosphate synthase/GTP cyclohydrolase II